MNRDLAVIRPIMPYRKREIDCIIAHAADIPTTQYENVMKKDSIDSEKPAKALKSGMLRGIYIPRKDTLDDRYMVRLRTTIRKQLGGYKSRIKHLLHSNGVEYSNCFVSSRPAHFSASLSQNRA